MDRLRGVIRIVVIAVLVGLGLSQVWVGTALAQDPTGWQGTAGGLATQQQSEKKTAGLGLTVQQQGWPFLIAPGGAKDASYWVHPDTIGGPVGIELGQVKVAGATGTFVSESADWAHDELTFSGGGATLKLWASRLSPALAVQSTGSALGLLAGSVSGYTYDGSSVSERSAAPSHPKYVAYGSGGGVQVRSLSGAALSLTGMDQDWVLLWYGNNSHFIDTKVPLTYDAVPWSAAYQGDIPVLVVFQNKPASIKQSSEGGVELGFSGGAGYLTLLPLLGRDVQRASVTEGWSAALPAGVRAKAEWWASHLCAYPATATESYAYNSGTDTATITEHISYLSVCAGGTSYAPIAPMLGLVKDTLGVTFTGTVVDSGLASEFGPILGIENAVSYSWSVAGLKRYVDSQRVTTGSGTAPAELEEELASQVQKVVSAGHLAPWVFSDSPPRYCPRGDIYWLNPGDSLAQLTTLAGALATSQKTSLVNYLKAERTQYPPEDVYELPITTGTTRGDFTLYNNGDCAYGWSQVRKDIHLQAVPLYNFYGLANYYDLTQETVPASVLQKAKATLDREMAERDWATNYTFQGYEDRGVAVWSANQHFAGLAGFIRLAKKAGDSQAESLGRALIAKAAVLRLGMAMYPRYLYRAGLVELPSQADWQPRYLAGDWFGYMSNYQWASGADDARQVATLDQFGPWLYETTGYGDWNQGISSAHLIAFSDMSPELGRLLGDYAAADVAPYVSTVESLTPHWYAAFQEGIYGQEHNLNHPVDAYQIFEAKALIQGESGEELASYVDIPWVATGDLFYLSKLAETVRAYRGTGWSDGGTPVATSTPSVATSTPTRTPTRTPTPAGTSVTATATRTPTPVTATPTRTPTRTATPGGATATRTATVVGAVTPSTVGLAGYWKLDEGSGTTAVDASGNGLTGSVQGGASWVTGQVGSALSLNGVNSGVRIGDSDLLSPHAGTAGEMTVAGWVKVTQLPAAAGQGRVAVVGKGGPATGTWEYALYVYADGAVGFSVWQASSVGYGEVGYGEIGVGEWHYLAGTVKKGQYVRVYLDGALVDEVTTLSGDTANGSAPLYVGRRGDGQYYNGVVDEVRVYNRALSEAEIEALMVVGVPVATATATRTATATATRTIAPTATRTVIATASRTPTRTATRMATSTNTATATRTATATSTATRTATATASRTATSTATRTATATSTATRTATATATIDPSEVVLSVDPPLTTVSQGEQFEVTIRVHAGAKAVDGAAAYVDFDPALLHVISVTAGSSLAAVIQNSYDNTLGQVNYSAGVLNGSLSGTFSLMTIRFETDGQSGASGLVFASGSPRKTAVSYQGQSVLDHTLGGTVTVGGAMLGGTVELQGRPAAPDPRWVTDLTVSVAEAEGARRTYTTTTTAEGAFRVGGLKAGTYEIAVKNEHTLRSVRTVSVGGSETRVAFGVLAEGDANNDDCVTLLDFSTLSVKYAQCSGGDGFDKRVDFNADGCVDILDFSLLSGNFGQTGGTAAARVVRDSGERGGVEVRSELAEVAARVGHEFTVTLAVEAGEQKVDGVVAYLDFDPTVLQVKGVTPGGRLTTVIQNRYDNEQGWVDYAAGVLGNSVSGEIELVMLRLEAVKGGVETELRFGHEGIRSTDVSLGGQSVIGPAPVGIKVMVGSASPDTYGCYLPLFLR